MTTNGRAGLNHLLVVCLLWLAAGCAKAHGDDLKIPLTYQGISTAKYMKSFNCVAIDTSTLALSWLDNSTDGDRIWTCRVSSSGPGRFGLISTPTLVDQGVIKQARLFVSDGRPGILYVKRNELAYRWPLDDAPQRLTTPVEQGVIACEVVGTSRRTVVLAVLIQLHGVARPTTELVGYVIADGKPIETHLATIAIRRDRPTLPLIQLWAEGDSVRVGLYGATVLSGALLGGASTKSADEEIEFHRFGLEVGRTGSLLVQDPILTILPSGHELEQVTSLSVLDPRMDLLAVAGPRQRLIALGGQGASAARISSATGAGGILGTPTVQIASINDSTGLVAWIDADRQIRANPTPVDLIDPTADGNDIRASFLNRDGRLLGPPPGFPVEAQAQCLALQRLGERILLLWVSGSKGAFDQRSQPRAVFVRELRGD